MTEDELDEWHHRLNGHEFEQTQGESEGQGSLECCSSSGIKELDTTKLKCRILVPRPRFESMPPAEDSES